MGEASVIGVEVIRVDSDLTPLDDERERDGAWLMRDGSCWRWWI